MSFRDIIKKSVLESFAGSNITTTTVCVTLGITIILALYIFAVYYLSTRKTFYNKTFNVSLAAIAVITASIILAMKRVINEKKSRCSESSPVTPAFCTQAAKQLS